MAKIVRNNMQLLAARKGQIERRRISLRTVANETGINRRAIYGIAQDTLRQYPKDVLLTLCSYFGCELGELLFIAEDDQ